MYLTKRIVIEQWHRSGLAGWVEIKPHPDKPVSLSDNSCWTVEGPMVIPFQEVFLRPAQGEERDIVLTEDFLANLVCFASRATHVSDIVLSSFKSSLQAHLTCLRPLTRRLRLVIRRIDSLLASTASSTRLPLSSPSSFVFKSFEEV